LHLGGRLRLRPALGDAGEQRLGAVGRLERRVRVDRPRDADQSLAPLGRSRVEQLERAAEAPACDARERRELLLTELGRVLADGLPHGWLREAPERNE